MLFNNGVAGGNSSFNSHLAYGGGFGANNGGGNGGSGGGGVTIGYGTVGQGYNGGANQGGGGGAGGAGTAGISGAGGVGITSSISGSAYTYATGGGGGTYAQGDAPGTTPGTYGSGGGGAGFGAGGKAGTTGNPGTQGIVIISYRSSAVQGDGTGGTITHVGGYTIQTFTSNGTFVAPIPVFGLTYTPTSTSTPTNTPTLTNTPTSTPLVTATSTPTVTPGTPNPRWGTGTDGDLTIASSASYNINTQNQGGRSCADGGDAVAYSVVSLGPTEASLSSTPSTGCLNVGDEVMLINIGWTHPGPE